MARAIGDAVGVPMKSWRAPLWIFLIAATILEATMRPLGLQPPLHRRRMDFFTKSFRIANHNARSKLGFVAQTDFAEGARRTAEWYRDNNLL